MKKTNERRTIKLWKNVLTIFISLILFCTQIIILYLSYNLKEFSVIYIVLEIIAIITILIIYRRVDESSAYKLTWTIIILSLPVFGIVLYLLVKNYQTLPKAKIYKIKKELYEKIEDNHKEQNFSDLEVAKILSFIKKDTNFDVYDNSNSYFYNDGKTLFESMFFDIKNAKKYVFLEYFIVGSGKLLDELLDILVLKASEGVEIKILYDDVGSVKVFKRKYKKQIENIKNIELVSFAPLGKNMNPIINYRDHRKITLIDGEIGYVGGANLADEYVHYITRFGYWRDNGIKIVGEACNNLLRLFSETWYLSTGVSLNFEEYCCKTKLKCQNNFIVPFGDGPMDNKSTFYDLFFSLFSIAKKSIYISTPYFIIDDMMIKSLVVACKMGVDVKILIPGIADKKMTYNLTMAHLGEILKAGGKVFKYNKGFNHAKNIIIDERYAFGGTVNIDYRSLFLHYECGILLIDDKSVLQMKSDFENELNDAEMINYSKWKKRNIFSRFIAFIFRVFSPLF